MALGKSFNFNKLKGNHVNPHHQHRDNEQDALDNQHVDIREESADTETDSPDQEAYCTPPEETEEVEEKLVVQPVKKSARSQVCAAAPTAASTVTVSSRKPAVTHDTKSKTEDTRISLVAKIDRNLHSRLKLHSYKTNKKIAELVEDWIADTIPEWIPGER